LRSQTSCPGIKECHKRKNATNATNEERLTAPLYRHPALAFFICDI
jgi:hypothetical protein